MIKANLLHLSYNMWRDNAPNPEATQQQQDICYQPYLRFDDAVWEAMLTAMAVSSTNMIVWDLGDAVAWESHSEIAVANAWSPERLRHELARCRAAGLEPIPKLNFATTHDAWLGPYSRMVSTKAYYEVCRDLIAETCQLFDTPRFFHIGMDEETWQHQRYYDYVVIRQRELLRHDLNFYCEAVRDNGARPWMWADMIWAMGQDGKEALLDHVSREVLMSNWYYGEDFESEDNRAVEAFAWLEELGFDQIPTGSNWSNDRNLPLIHEHAAKVIPPERYLGIMMADWRITTTPWLDQHLEAIRQLDSIPGR